MKEAAGDALTMYIYPVIEYITFLVAIPFPI